MAEITVLDPSVPVGRYRASFKGIDEKTFPYGQRWIWKFEIEGGEHDARTASAFSGTSPTLRSNAGKYVSMLAGASLSAGRSIDPEDFVGRLYSIDVAVPDGAESPRVVRFEPVDHESAGAGDNPF